MIENSSHKTVDGNVSYWHEWRYAIMDGTPSRNRREHNSKRASLDLRFIVEDSTVFELPDGNWQHGKSNSYELASVEVRYNKPRSVERGKALLLKRLGMKNYSDLLNR